MTIRDAFDVFMDGHGGDWFDGKIAGVTYRNDDGSDRQAIARELQPEDELFLRPEPDNPYDQNAIVLLDRDGRQVGYLEARTAKEVTSRTRRGATYRCWVRTTRESKGVCGVSFGLIQTTRAS